MEKVELFKDGKFTREMWAISALSDAQELIDRGFKKEACDKINDAKRIIKGKYEEIDDGFAIQVIRGRLAPTGG